MKFRSALVMVFLLLYAFAGAADTDTTKVNDLIKKSAELFNSDGARSMEFATQAKNLAEKTGFKKGEAIALKNIGIVYNLQGKFLEALDHWNKSLQIFTEINDKKGIANLLSNIGTIYNNSGNNFRALDYFLKALKLAEEINDEQRIYILYNNIGNVYQIRKDYRKALDYYLKAIPMVENMGEAQQELLGAICVNVGAIYTIMPDPDFAKAGSYLKKALKIYRESPTRAYAYNHLGDLSVKNGAIDEALTHYMRALSIAEKNEDVIPLIQAYRGAAGVYLERKNVEQALAYYNKAEVLAKQSNLPTDLSEIHQLMAVAYAAKKDFVNAYKYQHSYSIAQDSLYQGETNKKLGLLQFDFDLEKKQNQINLLTKDKSIKDLEIKKQATFRNALMIVLALAALLAFILYRSYRMKAKSNIVLDRKNMEIERLLLNILPAEVAHELRTTGKATPRNYEMVSVMFTDFRGFTALADKMTPQELVSELGNCFVEFDNIIERNGLEKIKTIGDAYMCAGGIPTPGEKHVFRMVRAGLEIQDFINRYNDQRREAGLSPWEARIGIHVGPVVAGVVGKKKYAYDIWGTTVNIASRMESNGIPGHVNISSAVYELVKNEYLCTYRGKIYAKNVGEIDMYLVDQKELNFEEAEDFERTTSKSLQNVSTPPNLFE